MPGNEPPYIPSRAEIENRCELLQWMQWFKWDQGVIDEIMYHDTPSILTVRKLVYKHGPEDAYKRIREFLE